MNKRPIASSSSAHRPFVEPDVHVSPISLAPQPPTFGRRDVLNPDPRLLKPSQAKGAAYLWMISHLFCFAGELALIAAIFVTHHDVWMLVLLLAVFGVVRSGYAGAPLLDAQGLANRSMFLVIFALPVIGSLALFKLSLDSRDPIK